MNENLSRLLIFISVLLIMATLEYLFPRKKRQQTRQQRWTTNAVILALEILVLRLLGPITAVVVANITMDNGWGLLSRLALPFYIDIIISFLVLDLAIYWQHVASHKIPVLWRFHKVHHADRDIDVTTGFRFHPIEAGLSMLYKCFIILIFGPIVTAVILFEIILNASAMFNHANVKLPLHLDKYLRFIIVTPDFHRVHHSTIPNETNSNYGFFVSIWDRLFKTYTAQPKYGHTDMHIGLNKHQDAQPGTIRWSLIAPFETNKIKAGKPHD